MILIGLLIPSLCMAQSKTYWRPLAWELPSYSRYQSNTTPLMQWLNTNGLVTHPITHSVDWINLMYQLESDAHIGLNIGGMFSNSSDEPVGVTHVDLNIGYSPINTDVFQLVLLSQVSMLNYSVQGIIPVGAPSVITGGYSMEGYAYGGGISARANLHLFDVCSFGIYASVTAGITWLDDDASWYFVTTNYTGSKLKNTKRYPIEGPKVDSRLTYINYGITVKLPFHSQE